MEVPKLRKACTYCKTEFFTNNTNRQFCSKACALKARYEAEKSLRYTDLYEIPKRQRTESKLDKMSSEDLLHYGKLSAQKQLEQMREQMGRR